MPEFLICGAVSYFADDVHARCAHCATAVVHRPHSPNYPKLCMTCAGRVMASRKTAVTVTAEAAREVALWRARTKGTH